MAFMLLSSLTLIVANAPLIAMKNFLLSNLGQRREISRRPRFIVGPKFAHSFSTIEGDRFQQVGLRR
jgi:hypothetical protein